jgi:LacI family transcriptional regulator
MNDPGVAFPQVAPDSHGSGWLVAEYLWRRGHRRIAFVCTNSTHPQFIARQQGVEGYLRQRENYDPALVNMRKPERRVSGNGSVVPETTPPDLEHEVAQLFDRPADRRPTAIVTANDWMTHGLYRALARRKLRIPRDVSVVGFDNMEPLCTMLTPPLTSFAVGFGAISQAATHDLLRAIDVPAYGRDASLRLIRGSIIERQSVAVMPSS